VVSSILARPLCTVNLGSNCAVADSCHQVHHSYSVTNVLEEESLVALTLPSQDLTLSVNSFLLARLLHPPKVAAPFS
jgi:hypothetical protein